MGPGVVGVCPLGHTRNSGDLTPLRVSVTLSTIYVRVSRGLDRRRRCRRRRNPRPWTGFWPVSTFTFHLPFHIPSTTDPTLCLCRTPHPPLVPPSPLYLVDHPFFSGTLDLPCGDYLFPKWETKVWGNTKEGTGGKERRRGLG